MTFFIFMFRSVFPSLNNTRAKDSLIFILLHYNLKLWQCYSP